MAVFRNPSKVVVTESGGLGAPVAVVLAVTAAASTGAALIADVLTVVLVAMIALAVTGTGVLVAVLRRSGLAHPLPPGRHRAPVPVRAARAGESLTARQPKQIGAHRVIPGTVETTREATPWNH